MPNPMIVPRRVADPQCDRFYPHPGNVFIEQCRKCGRPRLAHPEFCPGNPIDRAIGRLRKADA